MTTMCCDRHCVKSWPRNIVSAYSQRRVGRLNRRQEEESGVKLRVKRREEQSPLSSYLVAENTYGSSCRCSALGQDDRADKKAAETRLLFSRALHHPCLLTPAVSTSFRGDPLRSHHEPNHPEHLSTLPRHPLDVARASPEHWPALCPICSLRVLSRL